MPLRQTIPVNTFTGKSKREKKKHFHRLVSFKVPHILLYCAPRHITHHDVQLKWRMVPSKYKATYPHLLRVSKLQEQQP